MRYRPCHTPTISKTTLSAISLTLQGNVGTLQQTKEGVYVSIISIEG
jgi:hypothetical protein